MLNRVIVMFMLAKAPTDSRVRMQTMHARRKQTGFTLIESALTTVIIGVGVLAIVAAQQAYVMKNDWANRTGTGLYLANEIRERVMYLPLHDPQTGLAHLGPEPGELIYANYDDVDDYAGNVSADGTGEGLTISPPIDALGRNIDGLDAWTQIVRVENVLPNNISSALTYPLGFRDVDRDMETVRVTVEVQQTHPGDGQTRTITTLSWIMAQ